MIIWCSVNFYSSLFLFFFFCVLNGFAVPSDRLKVVSAGFAVDCTTEFDQVLMVSDDCPMIINQALIDLISIEISRFC